jgi:hypothetical protein
VGQSRLPPAAFVLFSGRGGIQGWRAVQADHFHFVDLACAPDLSNSTWAALRLQKRQAAHGRAPQVYVAEGGVIVRDFITSRVVHHLAAFSPGSHAGAEVPLDRSASEYENSRPVDGCLQRLGCIKTGRWGAWLAELSPDRPTWARRRVDVDVVVLRVGENRSGEFRVGGCPRGHKAGVQAGELER